MVIAALTPLMSSGCSGCFSRARVDMNKLPLKEDVKDWARRHGLVDPPGEVS